MFFTYMFYRESDGLTKIGRTRHPRQRFSCLGGGKKLVPIMLIKEDMEKRLHKRYAEYRVEGEWFRLPESVLAHYKKFDPSEMDSARFHEKIIMIKVSLEAHMAVKLYAAENEVSMVSAASDLIISGYATKPFNQTQLQS